MISPIETTVEPVVKYEEINREKDMTVYGENDVSNPTSHKEKNSRI